VEEINTIDDQNRPWLPETCSEIGKELNFVSNGFSSPLKLVDKKHYIYHEELLLSCNGNYEKGTYIEQKNEIIELAYLNPLFGSDTLYIRLRSMINTYKNQTPNPKVDIFSILHRRSNTTIANFYHLFDVSSTDFDYSSRTYHEEIEIDGQSFGAVVEFKSRENIHAEPHTRLYASKKHGFFAFEKNGKTYIKEI